MNLFHGVPLHLYFSTLRVNIRHVARVAYFHYITHKTLCVFRAASAEGV